MRFDARLWILLATLLTAAATARLGWWQLDRAAEKQHLQASRDAQQHLPVLQADELSHDAGTLARLSGRRVAVEGAWVSDATVYLDNRILKGRPGFFVVTPLVMKDGRTIAVQRGWLPRDARDRVRIAPYVTAMGTVRLQGRLAPTPSRMYELGDPASGPIRQNLHLEAFARELRRPLVPAVIVQDDIAGEAPSIDGLSRQWHQPASDAYKNRGYAFQWFGLCALIVTLYVWFQLVRPRLRRPS